MFDILVTFQHLRLTSLSAPEKGDDWGISLVSFTSVHDELLITLTTMAADSFATKSLTFNPQFCSLSSLQNIHRPQVLCRATVVQELHIHQGD